MAGDGPLGPRPAVLQAGGVALRGTFDDRVPMMFLLPDGVDMDLATSTARRSDLVVWWTDGRARYDVPVSAGTVDPRRREVSVEFRGPLRRVQRRTEVRVAVRLRCLVLGLDPDGVVTSPATTTNLSTGGAAVVLDKDADVGGVADLAVGQEIGLVLAVADRRMAAVAEVLAVRRRAGRLELRLRFTCIDRVDARDLATELRRLDARRPG